MIVFYIKFINRNSYPHYYYARPLGARLVHLIFDFMHRAQVITVYQSMVIRWLIEHGLTSPIGMSYDVVTRADRRDFWPQDVLVTATLHQRCHSDLISHHHSNHGRLYLVPLHFVTLLCDSLSRSRHSMPSVRPSVLCLRFTLSDV